MSRTLLNLIADTHSGHKVGLLNPDTPLTEETPEGIPVHYKPVLTLIQIYLWELYCRNRQIVSLSSDPALVILLGDLAWGGKYIDQLVSTCPADQFVAAQYALRPALAPPNVKTARIGSGTPAHAFGEGTAEIIIAKLLQGDFPDKNIVVVHHGLAEVAGVPIDYSHHGPPPGKRKWLDGNELRYYLRDIMTREIMAGKTPPRLVVRAHFHEYMHEYLEIRVGCKVYRSDIIILPSYDMLTDHVRQVAKSPPAVTNGEVVVEIVDGDIDKIHPLISVADVRTREVFAW